MVALVKGLRYTFYLHHPHMYASQISFVILTVVSSAKESTKRLSGVKAVPYTGPECPYNGAYLLFCFFYAVVVLNESASDFFDAIHSFFCGSPANGLLSSFLRSHSLSNKSEKPPTIMCASCDMCTVFRLQYQCQSVLGLVTQSCVMFWCCDCEYEMLIVW